MGFLILLISLTDPIGDHPVDSLNPQRYIDTDITVVKAANDSENLYFYVEINDSGRIANLTDTTIYSGAASISIFLDTDFDSTTGLTWGWWANGYDRLISVVHTPNLIDPWQIGDAFGIYAYNQDAHPVYEYNLLNTAALKSAHNDHRVEASVPLKDLAIKGDSIGILVIIQEQIDPWQGDYAPDEDLLGDTTLLYIIQPKASNIKIDGKFDDWDDVPELVPTKFKPQNAQEK